MFNGKPIIGIAGGIGSGKSFVAGLFGELGCVVISSDDLVHAAYADAKVRETVRKWWGPSVLSADGSTVDRSAIGRIVFSNPAERKRLETLLHPIVAEIRQQRMASAPPGTVAFVWDSPLLFETGLNRECDVVVFVEVDRAVQLERVRARGWNADELARREKSQLPLDKKRALAHDVLDNTADADTIRGQVGRLLSRILSNPAKEFTR